MTMKEQLRSAFCFQVNSQLGQRLMNLLRAGLDRTQRLHWAREMSGSFALVDGGAEVYVGEQSPQIQVKLKDTDSTYKWASSRERWVATWQDTQAKPKCKCLLQFRPKEETGNQSGHQLSEFSLWGVRGKSLTPT